MRALWGARLGAFPHGLGRLLVFVAGSRRATVRRTPELRGRKTVMSWSAVGLRGPADDA